GKIYPSRGLSSANDTRAGGRDDRRVRRDLVGGDGSPGDVAGGGISRGSGICNNAGRDHSDGRDRTPRHREESGKRVGGKPWNKPSAPVSIRAVDNRRRSWQDD